VSFTVFLSLLMATFGCIGFVLAIVMSRLGRSPFAWGVLAVAEDGGLIVPVVRDADHKSVSQISKDAKALIDKARAGKLHPGDYTGGTFTISNLGMFGIDQFTAVINRRRRPSWRSGPPRVNRSSRTASWPPASG
jgi:hypothetical protein